MACLFATFLFSATPASLNLLQLAKDAQSKGYLNLATYYYYHALLASPDDPQIAAAYQDANEKRKSSSSSSAITVAPGPKSDLPLPQGNGFWVQGNIRPTSQLLNDYNLASPRAQRVKYVFPPAGTLEVKENGLELSFEPNAALILADTLAGESRVYPVVEVSGQGIASISQSDLVNVAKNLSDKINADDRYSGLVLDFDAASMPWCAFFAMLKTQTVKPLVVVLSSWETAVFKFADLVVLKDFVPQGGREQVSAFLKDARAETTNVMIGLNADAGSFDNGCKAVAQGIEDNDPSLVGICIFPSATQLVPKSTWDLLRLPLERQ